MKDNTQAAEALRKAAQAVIDRWNSPNWVGAGGHVHTGELIANLAAALATPQQAEPPVKDHEIRDAVSALTEVAKTYHAQQQLRERIAQVVLPLIERTGWKAPAERFKAEIDAGESK